MNVLRVNPVLATAIIGLYKSAGVDLVRQQIEGQFTPPVPWYDVSTAGLVIWPDGEEDVEVLYDLDDSPWIAPQSVRGLARRLLPTVPCLLCALRNSSHSILCTPHTPCAGSFFRCRRQEFSHE